MENENREPDYERLIREEQTKKPYIKPAFRFERVFVTSALSCGKIDPTQTQCTFNRKVS
jgi:hypothetical protein